MNILVTGGTGFIGQALIPALVARGDQVALWTRSPESAARLFGQRVQARARLAELSQDAGYDALINLAGAPIVDRRWTEKRRRLLRESRIGLTRELIDWAGEQPKVPHTLISGSAIGYYGNHRDDLELTEAGEVVDGFAHQLCRDWEAEAVRGEALGMRVCRIRTGVVLGTGGGALGRMLPAFRLGLGGPIGSGQQWFSWVHRDDEVGAILHLLAHPPLTGAFNLTAPQPVTNETFARGLARVLGRPAFMRVPAWVLEAALGDAAELLVGGQRVVPERLAESGYRFRYPELDGALRAALSG